MDETPFDEIGYFSNCQCFEGANCTCICTLLEKALRNFRMPEFCEKNSMTDNQRKWIAENILKIPSEDSPYTFEDVEKMNDRELANTALNNLHIVNK